MDKSKDIKQLHSGKHANSTNSVRNPPHLAKTPLNPPKHLSIYKDILSKVVKKEVTELLKIPN